MTDYSVIKDGKMKKIASIADASAGIGKATAKLLVNKGYGVVATARRLDKMSDLRDMGARTYVIDMRNNESITWGHSGEFLP
jgi:NADP-dependent 3-hydroxy acid dehydrogenase YdfG